MATPTSAFQDAIIEIGCEELPARHCQALITHWQHAFTQLLTQAQFKFSKITSGITPRRLTLYIHDLTAVQPNRQVERRGPVYEQAFNAEGKPFPAALGFARSCGVEVNDLNILTTPKGRVLAYDYEETGKPIQEVLPNLLVESLSRLPLPKTMRWGEEPHRFLRPIRWLMMLYGKEVVPGELWGIKSSNLTYGHRFLHPNAIKISQPQDYFAQLEQAYVMVDSAKRRQAIESQMRKLTESIEGTAIAEEDLLNEVTYLVEWPHALLGKFEAEFLSIPSPVLIASMQDHQKSFAIHANGVPEKLLPNFISISNLVSADEQSVIKGNERVMRARLSDAKFFYENDLKTSFEGYLTRLKNVSYHDKLGNLYDKSQRVSELSGYIAAKLQLPVDIARHAGLLAKCDLVTSLVGEFPELQGIMGKYYALQSGEPEIIAIAIQEHYQPRGANDQVPATHLGAALALADKFDTLMAIFGKGLKPTAEKDPFGLRRAALSIVRICIEHKIHLELDNILQQSAFLLAPFIGHENLSLITEIKQFILERLRSWYQEQGIHPEVITAVLERQQEDIADIDRRIKAVADFQQLPAAKSLAQANKRVSKLLSKASGPMVGDTIQFGLLKEPAEKFLAEQITEKQLEIAPLFAARNYQETLQTLAKLHEPIDDFFDKVMVMVDDEAIRQNRLILLSQLRNLFLQIADISLLH